MAFYSNRYINDIFLKLLSLLNKMMSHQLEIKEMILINKLK
jgi:hypothetical protein